MLAPKSHANTRLSSSAPENALSTPTCLAAQPGSHVIWVNRRGSASQQLLAYAAAAAWVLFNTGAKNISRNTEDGTIETACVGTCISRRIGRILGDLLLSHNSHDRNSWLENRRSQTRRRDHNIRPKPTAYAREALERESRPTSPTYIRIVPTHLSFRYGRELPGASDLHTWLLSTVPSSDPRQRDLDPPGVYHSVCWSVGVCRFFGLRG
jgi:hypothetical protein